MTEQEQKDTLARTDERIAELQEQVELGAALERLHENEDFKLVITDAYLDAEGERLYNLLTNPSFFKRDQIQNTMDRLTSIRSIKEFFMVKLQEAHAAPDQITTENEFRTETTATKVSTDAELVD